MSAYIMDTKKLAIMAREIVDYIGEERRYGCRPFNTFTDELDALPDGTDKIEYTFKKLYALNQKSVNERYGENNADIPPMPFLPPKGGIIVNADSVVDPKRLISFAEEWQYQSNESDEVFYGEFYREVGEWAGRLAMRLVRDMFGRNWWED